MLTGPCATIDHGALRRNLALVRDHAPQSKVWAVIKADAYGHGMERAAASLSDAEGFAVARMAEAIQLREAGVDRPVLVMAGVLDGEELQAAHRYRCELAIHRREQLGFLEQATPDLALRAWIKVDTGMHRLGLDPGDVPSAMRRLSACPAVQALPGLMTHLANADDPLDPLTDRQCGRLRALAAEGQTLSIGNSGGIIAFPSSRTEWVRPGIMLYGASPLSGCSADALSLAPVMTLRTRLISVRRQRRGDRIGYGGSYSCPEEMPVGVAAIGYGDGYPRHAPSGTPVLVGKTRVQLVGRVSMDSITLDLRRAPDASPGDEVTLWGQGLPIEEIAARADTISYELFCGVTGRVRRLHIP